MSDPQLFAGGFIPTHALGGMPRLACVAIVSAMSLPFLVQAILRRPAPALATRATAA